MLANYYKNFVSLHLHSGRFRTRIGKGDVRTSTWVTRYGCFQIFMEWVELYHRGLGQSVSRMCAVNVPNFMALTAVCSEKKPCNYVLEYMPHPV